MATGYFNVGTDASLVLVDNSGVELRLNVTEFQSAQSTHQVQSMPLNDYTNLADIPDIWTGSFSVDRNSRALEAYVAAREAAFWNGATLTTATLYAYIKEIDGSQSKWEYGRLTFRLSHAGHYRHTDVVRQTIEFRASYRRAL